MKITRKYSIGKSDRTWPRQKNWRTIPVIILTFSKLWKFTSQQRNLASSSKRKNAQKAVTNKAAVRRPDRLADGEAYFEQIKEIISGVIGSFK